MHRQHVDDVGPFVSSLVAVAEQLRSNRVTVGLVVDQYASKGVPGRGAKGTKHLAKYGIFIARTRHRVTIAIRARLTRLGWGEAGLSQRSRVRSHTRIALREYPLGVRAGVRR